MDVNRKIQAEAVAWHARLSAPGCNRALEDGLRAWLGASPDHAAAFEKATELWDEGIPAAEIGRRVGITKNAVIGKAWRLDLPPRRVSEGPRPVPSLAEIMPAREVRRREVDAAVGRVGAG